MNKLSIHKIYLEAVKDFLDEDDAGIVPGSAEPRAAGDPIEVKTAPDTDEDDDDDIVANTPMGTKEILGVFDPNKGIGTGTDNYLPTKKRKKNDIDVPSTRELKPDDSQGELLKADAGKTEKRS